MDVQRLFSCVDYLTCVRCNSWAVRLNRYSACPAFVVTTKQNNKNTKKKYNTIIQITQIVGNSVREIYIARYIKLERKVTSVGGGKENQYIQAVQDFSQ